MHIHRHGAGPSHRPPESSFTGDVLISGFGQRAAPSRMVGAAASFGPGARTPWKVNPLGQTLVITSGVGWAQCEGAEVVEVRAGDWIWCPPGRPHWEGGTPDHAMTYIALHEGQVEFTGPVSDAQYHAGPGQGRGAHPG